MIVPIKNFLKGFLKYYTPSYLFQKIPSMIIIETTNICNLRCPVCPTTIDMHRSRGFMDFDLYKSIIDEFDGHKKKPEIAMNFSGEPMLHKNVLKYANILGKLGGVEIITNGDTLNEKQLVEIYNSRATRLLISLYDGEHQVEKFKKMISSAGIPKDFVILRDRWYSKDNNFGVKLTNRTGTIKIGSQTPVSLHKTCYYPSYQFLIDWNGDIFLCPQDWQRRVTMGNMMQENIFHIWTNKIITRHRKNLLNGKRNLSPCNTCNAQGTLLGSSHAKIWKEIYK